MQRLFFSESVSFSNVTWSHNRRTITASWFEHFKPESLVNHCSSLPNGAGKMQAFALRKWLYAVYTGCPKKRNDKFLLLCHSKMAHVLISSHENECVSRNYHRPSMKTIYTAKIVVLNYTTGVNRGPRHVFNTGVKFAVLAQHPVFLF